VGSSYPTHPDLNPKKPPAAMTKINAHMFTVVTTLCTTVLCIHQTLICSIKKKKVLVSKKKNIFYNIDVLGRVEQK